MPPFCAYGSMVNPCTDPHLNPVADCTGIVELCQADATVDFMWPLPAGAAVRAWVCPHHADVMTALLAVHGADPYREPVA